MLTEYFHNSHKDTKHYPNELCSVLNLDNTAVAFEEIKTWNGYSESKFGKEMYLMKKILELKVFITKMKALALD